MTSPYATFISSPYSHTPLYLTSIQKRLKKKRKKRKRKNREKEKKKRKKKREKGKTEEKKKKKKRKKKRKKEFSCENPGNWHNINSNFDWKTK
jgi:hypothetical protein